MIINGNALSIPLADKSVHCIVTSPPYWGLRNYGVTGQLGLERTPDEYISNMVAVFRECWRVLRDDGTMWVNLGDSYGGANQGGKYSDSWKLQPDAPSSWTNRQQRTDINTKISGVKPKDLVGIPWRVAFALQADGWYLRSDIIWSKPNPMPESVTDRPTKAHEYLFLLAKQERYYYDAEAVRESNSYGSIERFGIIDGIGQTKSWNTSDNKRDGRNDGTKSNEAFRDYVPAGRNRRTVWTIPTAPYKGAHFATYPPALVEPCIKAGTSERGVCPKCGKGWKRVSNSETFRYDQLPKEHPYYRPNELKGSKHTQLKGEDFGNGRKLKFTETTGWLPSCACDAGDPIPAIVFDPFAGSGTTVKVAFDLGRRGVGLDLSLEYLDKQATQRIHNGHTGRLI